MLFFALSRIAGEILGGVSLMRLFVCLAVSALALSACAGTKYQVDGPQAPPPKPVWVPSGDTARDSAMEEFIASAGTNAIYFDTNKSVLRPEAKQVLLKQAQWLILNRDLLIRVEGHCDERATEDYNYDLGLSRALAVKSFFVDMGLSPEKIDAVSFGEDSPAIDSPGDVRINRRVVTVVLR